jgi:hypothetical protein
MSLTKPRAHQLFDIDYKQSVRVLATTNINLSGGAPSTVDGVVLAAKDRVLVIGQSTASQNGLYYVTTLGTGENGTWQRSQDAAETGELLAGTIVMVTEGDVYADTQWKLITNNPIVIGSTELVWEQNSAFAFGNIFANGTAVLASTVGDTVTFTAGKNISIIGNSETNTVTVAVINNPEFLGNISVAGTSEVRFFDSDNSNYVAFKAADTVAANVTWTLPNTDGTVGQVLATNGAGILTWSTGGGGGGGISWTTQANTPPVIAAPGDFWYDSNSQIKYQYINDGTSNVWVDQSDPTTFASITTGQIVNANANGVGNIGAIGSSFGNVFASFFIGDGSQLTGLPEGYTDSNVTALLSSFGSNTITTTGNISGGNLATAGSVNAVTISATGNVSGGNLITAGLASVSSITKTGSNGVGNIGSASSTFNVVFARATSALYADLAEMYASDFDYTPGTVVIFGGAAEITQSTESHDTRVAGVVSTNPAFLMNSTISNQLELPVALTGRVPCRVQGPVRKGDLVVSGTEPGTAQRLVSWQPGCVIGKCLETIEDTAVRTIEVVVGRF